MYYNYRTNEYSNEPFPYNADCIPQDPASQALFKAYVEQGHSPEWAALDILRRHAQAQAAPSGGEAAP